MTPEDIHVRSLYLFVVCSKALEQFKDRLAATIPSTSPVLKVALERVLTRELGLLVRYWATRQVWERLEVREVDAKQLNLALLRLFFEGLRLPKDGSGMRYAELSTVNEEMHELTQRLTTALGHDHPPLVREVQEAILPWRDTVIRHTIEAIELPVDQLSARVKAWTDQTPKVTE